jgi:hypothetical protein
VYANHNATQMLGPVVSTLQKDVLPQLHDVEARTRAEMCLAILEWVRKLVSIEQQRRRGRTRARA